MYENEINKAASHWAKLLGWTPEQVKAYIGEKRGVIAVERDGNSFRARGEAQKIERGMNALKRAMDGSPSHQWLTAWK